VRRARRPEILATTLSPPPEAPGVTHWSSRLLAAELGIRHNTTVADAGLRFDHRTGTGVVLHMLSCLAIDGRFGLTAIGRTPQLAAELYHATKAALDGHPNHARLGGQ
jgi:hypothetical protein